MSDTTVAERFAARYQPAIETFVNDGDLEKPLIVEGMSCGNVRHVEARSQAPPR